MLLCDTAKVFHSFQCGEQLSSLLSENQVTLFETWSLDRRTAPLPGLPPDYHFSCRSNHLLLYERLSDCPKSPSHSCST